MCYMPNVDHFQEINSVYFNKAMSPVAMRHYPGTVVLRLICAISLHYIMLLSNEICHACENIYSEGHWDRTFTAHQHCDSICRKPVALTSLCLTESTILGKILNTASEEPMTSWSHKYYVLCFPHCCLMFHIEVETIKQTTAHKRMGPLIPRGIILVEGVFSTAPARKSY